MKRWWKGQISRGGKSRWTIAGDYRAGNDVLLGGPFVPRRSRRKPKGYKPRAFRSQNRLFRIAFYNYAYNSNIMGVGPARNSTDDFNVVRHDEVCWKYVTKKWTSLFDERWRIKTIGENGVTGVWKVQIFFVFVHPRSMTVPIMTTVRPKELHFCEI